MCYDVRMEPWLIAILVKPFAALALLSAGAVGTVAVQRHMKDGWLKSLLLRRFSERRGRK